MYLNLSSYLFADLEDLPALRQSIHASGRTHDMRGTVLLAPEGINVFVCGPETGARAFADRLKEMPGLAGLAFKESWSPGQSFNRLLVKLKKEIITFRRPACRPGTSSAYSSRIFAISKATLFPVRTTFHDAAGAPWKVLFDVDAHEVAPKVWRPALSEMRDLKLNETTLIVFDEREALRPDLEARRASV